jgi:RHS repeat-associated protein
MTQGKGSATESVTEYCYDEDENLKQVWDANHPRGNPGSPNPATQTYTYDRLNRLTQVSQPWTTGTADTKYDYDIQDHLAQVTDAESNVTTYTTSDRDLQTRQVSPVSGTTTYAYNEHGQLTSQIDARNITTTRTIDALDRVSLVHTSDGLTPDTTYTYDAPCTFGKGRLCSISNGPVVGYTYDRFGRVTQDGALGYQYDANGNRTQITQPGNVIAVYGYDFADRPNTLSYNVGAGNLPMVTSAKYLSSGPLTQLVLANGLTEQHLFDARYFPRAVTVTGPTSLNWVYSVDGVGNIKQITNGSTPRTYSYIDNLYFLKQGDGPWGTRSWTYDRIGNRLTETRDTTTDTYAYVNHNPRLTSVTMGGEAGTKDFSYDPNGNEIRLTTPLLLLFQRYDGANRLFHIKDDATGAATYLTYDGRNFLTQARQDITTCCSPVLTKAVYSSEGVLQGRSVRNILGGTLTKDTKVLYFAGRPVGLLEMTTTPVTLSYLSVDHLGTPILATNGSGSSLWSGGFEPFGKDWNGAQAAGEFLRLPGQWEDSSWLGSSILKYNLNRWYESETGRYSQKDPLGIRLGNPYSYTFNNPLRFSDRKGLQPHPAWPLGVEPPPPPPTPPLKLVPPPICEPAVVRVGETLLGLAARISAGLTVAVSELFFPDDAEAPTVDQSATLETPYTKPCQKCGSCTPSEHAFLQGLVDRFCKNLGPSKCLPGQDPQTLMRNYQLQYGCVQARAMLIEQCFKNDMDPGHAEQLRVRAEGMMRCAELLLQARP